MVGILELEDRRGRRTELTTAELLGLRLLRAGVPVPEGMGGKRLERRVDRGARALRRAGARRVLTAADCPARGRLSAWGLSPVDPVPFCQALAAPLALAALARLGRSPLRAAVALRGDRVSRPLLRAAQALCPRVRYLLVDVPDGGEDLADWLRADFGAAILRPGSPADVVLCFAPGGCPEGCSGLCLHGPRPDLAGLRPVLHGLSLPPGLDPLPALALLWETGRLELEKIQIC